MAGRGFSKTEALVIIHVRLFFCLLPERKQANALASAILLPRELVEKGMFLFSLGDKIEVLNKIYFHKVYEQFSGLAQFLGVSKQALSIRMKQLGLLEHDYLNDPDSILEVVGE